MDGGQEVASGLERRRGDERGEERMRGREEGRRGGGAVSTLLS